MLDYMRKNARSTAVKIIYGAIIIVFCFWGVGTMVGGDRVNVAAMVDDEPITAQAYSLAYERLQRTYQDIYRESFNEQVLAQLNLEQRALDELVTGMLLRREANRLGLSVRDDEVRDSILAIPTFHDSGRFDRSRYLATLRASRVTPTEFEESQRDALLIQKLESLITNGIYVSDAEVEDLFELENEQIDVTFARVPYERFRDAVEITDDEIQAHYDERQEAFRQPEKVTLTYVAYDPEEFQEKVDVNDDAIRAYYETHTDEFETQARVSLRHILIAMSPDADDATKESARAKAEEVLAEAKQEGADFAALATEHSDDLLSADAGGDLGFVEHGQLEAPLEEAAFALDAGTVAEAVVETPRGLHIVRVDEREETSTRPLDDVRSDIVRELQERGADDAARNALAADAAAARGGEKLDALASARSLEAVTTDPTPAGVPLAGVTGAALLNNALALDAGAVGEIEGVDPPYYLFTVVEKTPSAIQPLADARDRIVELITRDKTRETAEAEAAKLLQAAREGNGLVALVSAAEAAGYTVDSTGPVKRNDTLTKLDRAPIGPMLFELSEASPIAEEPFILPNDAVAAVLKERVPTDPEGLDDEKRDSLRSTALSRRQGETLQAYRDLLRQRAEISINPNIVN